MRQFQFHAIVPAATQVHVKVLATDLCLLAATAMAGVPMRVVLVDPSRTMRLFVTRLLEAGGHEVKPCADGPEALACLRADPDIAALIASGELASSMSGLELCWETRVLAGRDR